MDEKYYRLDLSQLSDLKTRLEVKRLLSPSEWSGIEVALKNNWRNVDFYDGWHGINNTNSIKILQDYGLELEYREEICTCGSCYCDSCKQRRFKSLSDEDKLLLTTIHDAIQKLSPEALYMLLNSL